MKTVEINCPRSLDLKSINLIREKHPEAKSILQTVSIYDSISLTYEMKKDTGIVILSKEKLSDELKENIRKLLGLFSCYVGIMIKDLIIDIKVDPFSYLRAEENLLAGFLIGLNYYFNTNLTIRELFFLADKINPLISYYIVGGYKKIDLMRKNSNIGDNPFNKYLLIDKFEDENKEEERLYHFFVKYQYLSYGKDLCHFIAIKDSIAANVPISLKKEFPNVVLRTVNNVKEPKVLVKYLK